MNTQHVDYQGSNIRYSQKGNGDALVLIHGFIGRIDIWKDMQDSLSKHFNVICIELPGHGKSDLIADVLTMEVIGDMIKYILKELRVTKAVMVGHSMGGYVLLDLVERHQEIFKGIGLFHSHALEDTAEAKENRSRAVQLIEQNREGYISNFIDKLFAEPNREKFKTEISILQKGAQNTAPETLIASLLGMRERKEHIGTLVNLKIPAMFIIGKEDPRMSFPQLITQATLPQYSEILVLGECGHMGYIEKYEETCSFIKSFTENCYK